MNESVLLMPCYGKITSFEQEMNAGMITSHQSGHAVMFLGGDVKAGTLPLHKVVGRRVSFDIIQTAKGNMAVNVSVESTPFVRPGDHLATLVAPFLVAGTGYYFYEYIGLSLLLSYLAAVNLIGFILLICQSSRGPTYKITYSEYFLGGLAVCGSALSIFFASALVPSKWRSEAGRFALFALVVLHLITLRALEPGLMSKDFKNYLYRSTSSHESLPFKIPDVLSSVYPE